MTVRYLCSVSLLDCGLSIFFFFKQKTAYEMRISDWSSDVCSSDLLGDLPRTCVRGGERHPHQDVAPIGPHGPPAPLCHRPPFKLLGRRVSHHPDLVRI